MKAWLITQNPGNWQWSDFEDKIAKTQAGEIVVEPWTCASKQVSVGDRVFLMRTGSHGRGIYGAGHCVKSSYDAQHYDPEKAKQGITSPHIDVAFDWIIDPDRMPYIQQDILKRDFSNQEWSPNGSGISIKDEYIYDLELAWAKCIGVEHDVKNLLKASKDINADQHDGSYELVRETVHSYSNLSDTQQVTFADIDLIYLMAIIFTNTSRNSKKIATSSLPESEKTRLAELLKTTWENAENHEYNNIAKDPISVGMFGSGFYTFQKSSSEDSLPQKIIKALVTIFRKESADEIYQYLIDNYKDEIRGIGVAAFSVIAHCLRPELFPIINRNECSCTVRKQATENKR